MSIERNYLIKPEYPSWFIADDDVDDQILMNEALQEIKVPESSIRFATSGSRLIELLRSEAETPCIVMLDLNMPNMDGWEALSIIKNDEHLKMLPLIVFTTSREQTDINKAYNYGVNSFFSKPSRFSELKKMVSVINLYWMRNAILHTREQLSSG